jgi:hypothetical protein
MTRIRCNVIKTKRFYFNLPQDASVRTAARPDEHRKVRHRALQRGLDNKIIPTFKVGAEYLGACSVCACDSKLMHAWFQIARSARLGSEMYPLDTHRVGVIEGCTRVCMWLNCSAAWKGS